MKILIVDDDPITLGALVDLLSMESNIVDHAENGHSAIVVLQMRIPDVIIMDWRMPYVDGHDLFQQIKGNPKWQHIPILVLTAMAPCELEEELNKFKDECKEVRVLYKPVPLDVIKQNIQQIVGDIS